MISYISLVAISQAPTQISDKGLKQGPIHRLGKTPRRAVGVYPLIVEENGDECDS